MPKISQKIEIDDYHKVNFGLKQQVLQRNIDIREAFKEIVHDYPSLKKVTKLKFDD